MLKCVGKIYLCVGKKLNKNSIIIHKPKCTKKIKSIKTL